MKKTTLWAVCVTAVLFFGFLQVGRAQICTDNFEYPIGDLLTAHGWVAHSGAASQPIDVTTGLSYTGYAGSGTGGAANLDNTGEDDSKTFTAVTSGTLYFAFLTNVTTGTSGYYIHLGGSTSAFAARVFVKPSATAGKINFGLSNTSTASYAATPTDFDPLTTYLVIIKYDVSTTGAASMWIKSSGVPISEVDAGVPEHTTSGTGQASIDRVCLRQYSSTQNMAVDGIRLATNWADAVTPSTGAQVENPTFSPASGNYFTPQSVTISCATVGASIYYTTDGITEPTESSTPYTIPIPVSTTTVIKARAYLSPMTPSGTATALYQFPVDVANIAALRAGVVGNTVYRLTGEAIVTYQRPDNQRNQMYIQDATAAIVVDDLPITILTDYNIGDGVTGITGTLSSYNNLLEFIPLLDPGAPTSTGNTITPIAKTLATITSADQAKLVSIPAVSFTAPSGNYVVSVNYPITDPSGSGVFRTLFTEADYLGTPIPTTPQNMIALVGQSAAVMQITPRFASDITPFTPSWVSGWPKAENPTSATFNAKVEIDVPGTAYFVVLPNGAAAPTSLQVQNGQDATGTPVAVNLAGTIACVAGNTEYVVSVTGLTATTTYNVYFVAEAYTNLQAVPVMKTVTTTSGGAAPVIISPTATGMTDNSAVLGGNITFDGGSAITERGTVWKSTPGVTIGDHKQAASGTSTGIFTDTRTGLPAASLIYYAAYATNAIGTTLTSESSFYTLTVEPSNHATAFAAGTTTTTTIPLTWTDATGTVVPTAYLIKGSSVSYAAITDPADGTPEADAALIQNVSQGVGTYTFTGLSAGTPYYFKIYPYTGSLATINYKTTPAAPTATATTVSAAYTWIGADNGDWTVSTNWSPTRTSPAAVDILQFNDGTTKTVTGVPATETIGQLVLANSTTVNLQSLAAAVLTIAGLTGTDLVVPAGSALNLTAIVAANTITLTLSTGASAEISGSISVSGLSTGTVTTAHRLIAASTNAIAVHSGGAITAGKNFAGNLFGTTPTAGVSSVQFENGSTFIHQAGSNPFASNPSVTVFQTGSLYKVTGAVTPSYSGRTYANLEYDLVGGIFTQTGASAVNMDNLTVTNGTVNFNVTTAPGHNIKGNITVAAGGILNFSPTAAGTVNLSGLTAQTISGGGTIKSSALSTIVINNINGVTLNANDTINGTLTLTSGLLTLGTGNLTFGATGVLSGTPSVTNMIVATNTGELRKTFTAAGSYTYPIGDNTGVAEYSPVTLNFTAGTFDAAYAGVNLNNQSYLGTTGDHLSRYWNVSSSGITAFSCDAQFNYVPADVIGNESNIYCVLIPSTNYSPANTTGHYLTATGVTSFGTFTGREQVSGDKTLNLTSIFLEGLYNGSGTMRRAADDAGYLFTDPLIADQITVELHNASYGSTPAAIIPNVDLSTTGVATVTVPSSNNGFYYITIKHRNHIETTSAATIDFSGSNISYAFDLQSKVYGNNIILMSGGGTFYAIYGGDVNQDNLIDGGDMTPVDNLNFSFGYGNQEDTNSDGIIDAGDMTIVDNNAYNFISSILP